MPTQLFVVADGSSELPLGIAGRKVEIIKEDELINIIEDWRNQRYVEELRAKSMQGYQRKASDGLFPTR